MPAAAHRAWPAAGAYRYLDGASPSDLAWEWLRRDPDYRRLGHDRLVPAVGGMTIAHPAPAECTARWGCLTLPSPELPFTETPILWSSAVDPSVLKVLAVVDSRVGAPFDLQRCGIPTVVLMGAGYEHVRLGRGGAAVRLDVVSGSLLDGPVALFHDLTSAERPTICALHRFLHFCRTGRLPAYSPPASQTFRRQAVALRVADALAQGASIRDVGVILFGAERVNAEWSGEALKSQCRRLIAQARAMAGGGYRGLLL